MGCISPRAPRANLVERTNDAKNDRGGENERAA
jgi:hypothetical protein